MRNFKRLATSLVALALVFAFSSCEKQQVDTKRVVEVSFDIASLGNKAAIDVKKDGGTIGENPGMYPTCTEDEVAYVVATIDGSNYTLQMTDLEGNSQTEVIQLNADAENQLTGFVAYNSEGTAIYEMPKYDSDEVLKGGLTGLPMNLELSKFTKTKIDVDVVCWHSYSHMNLTWAWYDIDYHQLKTLCFFGDICTKYVDLFHEKGSPYNGQNPDGYDFPAIFDVVVTNTETEETWTVSNADYLGIGSALCVTYRDDLQKEEHFTYEIFLYMPTGDPISIAKEEFEDGIYSEMGNENGFGGADGVYTFAIGNCDTQGNNDVNLVMPAYVHIPDMATMTLSDGGFGNGETYWTAVFTNFSPNLDYSPYMTDGEVVKAFCGDFDAGISPGTYNNVKLISSLDPSAIPADYADIEWGAVNWAANHLDLAGPTGTPAEKLSTAKIIQDALWHFTNGKPGNAFSALAEDHLGYVPPVGGWAIVLCDAPESKKQDKLQLIVIRVDP